MRRGAKPRWPAGAVCALALILGSWAGASGGSFGMNPDASPMTSAAETLPSPPVRTLALAAASSQAAANPQDDLAAIGIPQAWSLLGSRKADVTGTIAVVDTGVDLTHPQLAPYLTEGANLLEPGKPPQDDNGHGTAVAGVLAEIAGAAQPANGAEWRMRIMPIKALDRHGEGDEDDLAAGIRYAVEHGADIVVLSLGLRRDTPEMRDVVALAERKGVLLVAASGNDGAEFGAKAAVQYPAAYPTVLAVAGSSGSGAQTRSTTGPEVDVSAPWRIVTLKLGGGTVAMEGSSMSAPQAAGAAAMLRALHPDWPPGRLRDTLRRTAEDIAAKGWDRHTGFGQVRADRALQADATLDWHEPNDSRAAATVFPLGAEMYADWSTAKDIDGYTIDVPDDGSLKVTWQLDGLAAASPDSRKPSLQLYGADSAAAIAPAPTGGAAKAASVDWPVKKGKYYLKTSRGDAGSGEGAQAYRLTSSFAEAPDPMEPNPNALMAYTLAPHSQSWTGTFSSEGDEDWTVITLPRPGKLLVRVDVDTTRIDPAILLQRAGEDGTETDDNGEGRGEEIDLLDAEAGKYYIRIRNAVSANPSPVIGTYTVRLEYITLVEDLQEPNDDPLTATPLALESGDTRSGLIESAADADWFRFSASERELVRFRLDGLPKAAEGTVKLYGKQLNLLREWQTASGEAALAGQLELEPGIYYLKLTANAAARDANYRLSIKGSAAGGSFADIDGHWGADAIRAVAEAGWIGGYEDGTFRPDRALTRAEAIAIAVRAAKPGGEAAARSRFDDVTPSLWAYSAVLEADGAGWLTGYSGSKLAPGKAMTRGEAAVLFAKAAKLSVGKAPAAAFPDVPASDPAAGALEALKRKGWIHGFADGTFRPEQPISRAEWAVLLAQLL